MTTHQHHPFVELGHLLAYLKLGSILIYKVNFNKCRVKITKLNMQFSFK